MNTYFIKYTWSDDTYSIFETYEDYSMERLAFSSEFPNKPIRDWHKMSYMDHDAAVGYRITYKTIDILTSEEIKRLMFIAKL